MTRLFAAAIMSAAVIGCSSNVQPQLQQPERQCFTDEVFHESAIQEQGAEGSKVSSKLGNKVVESKTKTCTDRPGIEQFARTTGVAKNCRLWSSSYRVGSQKRFVRGYLCQFPDGSWRSLDSRKLGALDYQ
jgi:surface antigen